MNKQDKKELVKAYKALIELTPLLTAMKDIAVERQQLAEMIIKLEPMVEPLENMAYEMEEKYESGTEKWKDSHKGEMVKEQADYLQKAYEGLYNCVEYLQMLTEN